MAHVWEFQKEQTKGETLYLKKYGTAVLQIRREKWMCRFKKLRHKWEKFSGTHNEKH